MPYIESEMEFIQRHGGPKVQVRFDTWLLPDGASIVENGFGTRLFEPPSDPKGRIRARIDYVQAKLAVAEKAFETLKGALLGNTTQEGMPITYTWQEQEFGPAPGRDGTAALLVLKEIADRHRGVLQGLQQQYDALPEVQAERRKAADLERSQAEARSRESAKRLEIQAITI